MSLPSSKTDICNLALDYLGQPPIASIDPPATVTEILMSRHYDDARQTVLRKYVWNCAKRRAAITRSGTPEFDFDDKYQLPNDFVRFLSVGGDEGETSQSTDYDIEGRELLINASAADSVNLRYIADIEDVTVWDAGFRKIVVLTLALAVAYQITKKKTVVDQINQLLSLELSNAVGVDGQEVPPRRIQRSKYRDARGMGSFGSNVAGQNTILP